MKIFGFSDFKAWAFILTALGLLSGCNQANTNATNDATKVSSNEKSTPVQSTSETVTPTVAPAQKNLPNYIAMIDPIYPPFEFKNPDGTSGGMEVEIFNAIAKDQGFSVTYVPHVWEGIFDSMQENKAKFVVSAVTATPEAQQKANLSKPYYNSPYRVATTDPAKLATWKEQPRIGIAESEDTQDELPTMGVKATQLVPYKTVFLALGALAKGEVDAVVADSTVLQYNMRSESYAKMANSFVSQALPSDSTSDIVFAVDKGSPELLTKVNNGIDKLKASGELDRILKKYHQDITPTK